MFGPLSDVLSSMATSNELVSDNALAAFPQMPSEDMLAHVGAQYMLQVHARLADMGLLVLTLDLSCDITHLF